MTPARPSGRDVSQQMAEFDLWLLANWLQFAFGARLDNVPPHQIAACRAFHERQRPAWRAAHYRQVCADQQAAVVH